MKILLIILVCMMMFLPFYYFCGLVDDRLHRGKKLKYVIYYRAKGSANVKRITASGQEAAKFEVQWINKYYNEVVRIDVFDGRKKIDTGKADDIFN